MTDSRQETGRRGEAYARRMMEERGYRILATNYRSPHGEIDIVAADGRGIVFVEVRARRSRAYGPPEESLTPAKRRHLVATAEHYVGACGVTGPWRIDLIAVEMDGRGVVRRASVVENAVTGDDLEDRSP